MGRVIPYMMDNKKCSKPPTRCVCVNEIAWIQNHQQPKHVHGSPWGTTGKSSIFVRENVWITVEIPPVKYRNWKQNEQNYGSLGPVMFTWR